MQRHDRGPLHPSRMTGPNQSLPFPDSSLAAPVWGSRPNHKYPGPEHQDNSVPRLHYQQTFFVTGVLGGRRLGPPKRTVSRGLTFSPPCSESLNFPSKIQVKNPPISTSLTSGFLKTSKSIFCTGVFPMHSIGRVSRGNSGFSPSLKIRIWPPTPGCIRGV